MGRPNVRLSMAGGGLVLLLATTSGSASDTAADDADQAAQHPAPGAQHDDHGVGHPTADASHDDHHSGPRYVLGVKASYLEAVTPDEIHAAGGGGLFFEFAVVPHWFEIEYGVRVLTSGHGLSFPADIIFKIPFHPTDAVQPFVGIGPTLVPAFEDGTGTVLHGGGVLAVGSYFWAWSWGGLLAEVNYNLLYDHGVAHEAGLNVGLAYRF